MTGAFATTTDLERDAAFWRLYDASFQPSTREPASVILTMVESGAGFVLRVRRDDETVGFSVVHLLRSPARHPSTLGLRVLSQFFQKRE